jgi:hypothetical protein
VYTKAFYFLSHEPMIMFFRQTRRKHFEKNK